MRLYGENGGIPLFIVRLGNEGTHEMVLLKLQRKRCNQTTVTFC